MIFIGLMAYSDVRNTNLAIVDNWIDWIMNSIQKSQQALQGDAISEQVFDSYNMIVICSKREFCSISGIPIFLTIFVSK